MNDRDYIAFDALVVKVQQQEETISQLMEIVAATNKRVTELARKQQEKEPRYTPSR